MNSCYINDMENNTLVTPPNSADELFVFSRVFSRGDENTHKFRITKTDITEAVKVHGEGDEAVEQYLQHLDRSPDVSWLLGEIANPSYDNNPAPDFEKGFWVFGEEAEYGVGPTKEIAKIQFASIPRDNEDGGDEDW